MEMGLCDQFTLSHLIAHPELAEGYDLKSLTGFMTTGSRTSTNFRARMLKYWPDSVVRRASINILTVLGTSF